MRKAAGIGLADRAAGGSGLLDGLWLFAGGAPRSARTLLKFKKAPGSSKSHDGCGAVLRFDLGCISKAFRTVINI